MGRFFYYLGQVYLSYKFQKCGTIHNKRSDRRQLDTLYLGKHFQFYTTRITSDIWAVMFTYQKAQPNQGASLVVFLSHSGLSTITDEIVYGALFESVTMDTLTNR